MVATGATIPFRSMVAGKAKQKGQGQGQTEGERWKLCPSPIASHPLLARLSAGSISTPPVDTLGLAVGRRCGFGREGASGYDPCLLEIALPGGVGNFEPEATNYRAPARSPSSVGPRVRHCSGKGLKCPSCPASKPRRSSSGSGARGRASPRCPASHCRCRGRSVVVMTQV